jgi:hypothetical protein
MTLISHTCDYEDGGCGDDYDIMQVNCILTHYAVNGTATT